MSAHPSRSANAMTASIWMAHHRRALVGSFLRCLRRPWATLLTVLVMGMALLLPMGLSIILDNVRQLAGSVEQSRTVNLYLHPDFTEQQARLLAGELSQWADVESVAVTTPEEGLEQLRSQAGMGAAIEALEDNPLPSVLQVIPRAAADPQALARSLEALPQADLVQHDAQWRQRLEGWLTLGGRLASVLALLFGAGAVLVVGNTVRLELLNRAEEVRVLQQLGADDPFIRRPFLYLGAWYGLGAGVVALVLWSGCVALLQPPLAALVATYGSSFTFGSTGVVKAALVVGGAVGLGIAGAWLMVSHALRAQRVTLA